MELYLHSDVTSDQDNGVDFRMAAKFVKELHAAERSKEKNLVIHLETLGGEWTDGMWIYDAIALSSLPATMICHGIVCSMGTVIMQAAKKRLLMPHCDLMVHHGSLTVSGPQLSVESEMKYNVKIKNIMLDIYAERCQNGKFFKDRGDSRSKTRAYIKRKIETHGDWYLNPEEAVEFGFADGILSKTKYLNVRQVSQ
jgi:ATP-dependent protease ClpP protease subunit